MTVPLADSAPAAEAPPGLLEWRKDDLLLSTDPARLDLALIHRTLAASYWAAGIPETVVRRAVANSIPFGVYDDPRAATGVPEIGVPEIGVPEIGAPEIGAPKQVAFARVVTDRATFAWVSDVFVLPAWRGRGLSKWMMAAMQAHPDLQALRRWMLGTRDAHGLYRRFGFVAGSAERLMEKLDPDIYRRTADPTG